MQTRKQPLRFPTGDRWSSKIVNFNFGDPLSRLECTLPFECIGSTGNETIRVQFPTNIYQISCSQNSIAFLRLCELCEKFFRRSTMTNDSRDRDRSKIASGKLSPREGRVTNSPHSLSFSLVASRFYRVAVDPAARSNPDRTPIETHPSA